MMTREAQEENEVRAEHEFLDKLGALVIEYRTQVRCGLMLGALETVKLRLFIESSKIVDAKMSKDKSDDCKGES